MNLFLFLCCLAKQQYDIEKDEESEGTSTGWSDEIRINMVDFCKSAGKKTTWYNIQQTKEKQYQIVLENCKDIHLHYINQKEDYYQKDLKVIVIFHMQNIIIMF